MVAKLVDGIVFVLRQYMDRDVVLYKEEFKTGWTVRTPITYAGIISVNDQ